jgi:tRNA threonylcarbamoyladenosine biosynthesis protein TsaB
MSTFTLPRILAIDTSTIACSVALVSETGISHRFQVAPKQHTTLVLPMIEHVLEERKLKIKDLSAVACASGPGSFTGVRLATSIAQGIAFANNLPVIVISSLRTLAQKAFQQAQKNYLVPLLDARMQQVYYGCYQWQNQTLEGHDHVASIENVNLPTDKQWIILGDENYADKLKARFPGHTITLPDEDQYPEAKELLALATHDFQKGLTVDAAAALPVYLREAVS